MRGRTGQVVELGRVGPEVEELLAGPGQVHGRRRGRQCRLGVKAVQLLVAGLLIGEDHRLLNIGSVGQVVTHVFVPVFGQRPREVVDVVRTVAGTDHECAGRRGLRSEEWTALHVVGHADAAQGQDRRRHVDEAHQAIGRPSRRAHRPDVDSGPGVSRSGGPASPCGRAIVCTGADRVRGRRRRRRWYSRRSPSSSSCFRTSPACRSICETGRSRGPRSGASPSCPESTGAGSPGRDRAGRPGPRAPSRRGRWPGPRGSS